MIEDIMASLRNWFTPRGGVHRGEYTISGGALDLPFLAAGQRFRVVGSKFNDGVHLHPSETLTDETFTGEIWEVNAPAPFLALVSEIEAWQEKHGDAPYTAESFGGYSYSRGADASGAPLTWAGVFRARLNRWRKV